MIEAPLSPLGVYSARPTVQVDGQTFPKVSELVVGMDMTEREGGLSALELRLSNIASEPQGGADFAFEDDGILRLGAGIVVFAGDETAPTEIFRGVVTGLEGDFPATSPPELVVLAEDALQGARLARRTKVYSEATLSDLATRIAGQLGLTPVVTGLSDNIGTQVQLDESDLAFLRRVLARYDGDVQVVGSELHVSPRDEVRRGVLDLVLHSQLRWARALADLAHQVTEVTVGGWDAKQGRRVSGRGTGAATGPVAGRTGAQVLDAALGSRAHHVGHPAVTTTEEAQALADTVFDQRARRFVTIEGAAEGNPAIRVGTHLNLTGLGDRFSNTYYVVRAGHHYSSRHGYETTFEAECAFWGGS